MMEEYLGRFVGLLPVLVLWAWCGGIVARRAGYSRWWGLPMLLPPCAIALAWWFAFRPWPAMTVVAVTAD